MILNKEDNDLLKNLKHIKLTEREKTILIFLVKGLTNKEIGDLLHISEFTVKLYVTRIIEKFHAKNRTHVAFLIGTTLADKVG